jgi:hypothetical protein
MLAGLSDRIIDPSTQVVDADPSYRNPFLPRRRTAKKLQQRSTQLKLFA